MKIISFIVIMLTLFLTDLTAQTGAKSEFKMEGQIAASTNGEAVFINIGGPALKFIFPKFAFSVNMVPSLKFEEDKQKSDVTPLLGVGMQFYFLKDKRFVLIFPCYYYAARNIWTLSAGIGYVLSKPK